MKLYSVDSSGPAQDQAERKTKQINLLCFINNFTNEAYSSMNHAHSAR